MTQHPAQSGRGAFTLVEMLVAMVIAMIIILLTSFAWRSASQVVARTDALLRAHQKAGALMSTFRSAAEQSTVTLPMVVENQLLINGGPNLAFYFSDGSTTSSPGGTTTLRDSTLPKVLENDQWVYPVAIWGVGYYDTSHPQYYGLDTSGNPVHSDGEKVKRENKFMYDLATVGFRFRWTRWTRETGEATGMATTTEDASTQYSSSGLVPGGKWQANYPFFYRRSVTPRSSFSSDRMKFAYRSLSGDPSHHDAYKCPDTGYLVYGGSAPNRIPALFKNISGSTEPEWPTRYGDTVDDGEIVWQAVAPTLWFVQSTAPLMSVVRPYGTSEDLVNYALRGSFNQNRTRGVSAYGTLADDSNRSPFAHGIGRFHLEWDTTLNNLAVPFDDGVAYRNLDLQGNDAYIGLPICRGFVANDPRGGEPLLQPRVLKLNFNVVEIPTGTIGEAVVQDFSVRAWIR